MRYLSNRAFVLITAVNLVALVAIGTTGNAQHVPSQQVIPAVDVQTKLQDMEAQQVESQIARLDEDIRIRLATGGPVDPNSGVPRMTSFAVSRRVAAAQPGAPYDSAKIRAHQLAIRRGILSAD